MSDDFYDRDLEDTQPGCPSGKRVSSQRIAATRALMVEDLTCKGCGEMSPANPLKKKWELIAVSACMGRWVCPDCFNSGKY